MSAKKKRGPTMLVILVVALGGAVWAGSSLGGGGESDGRILKGAAAERGPLRISVIERGNLKAADSVTLKSEIEGSTTVLWLIEEGTMVEPGELLCELDTASLVDRRVSQEIRVQNAEAAFVKAEQNHAIQVSQNESDIARADQALEFARLDLTKYLEGDLPQELESRDEAILLADEELTLASQDLMWSERLAEKGFLEQAQLDADRTRKTRAEVTLAQAKRAKELMTAYEVPRRKKELQAAVEEAVRELDRVKLQATARLADFDADLRTSSATLGVERDELDKILSQIEKSELRAPVAGMVVYARDRGSRWGGGEPMQEGANVRERQDIITIPSSQGYIAEASLHESVLEKVGVGMGCQVTVDALGQAFPGAVSFKAVLPDQNSWFANPDLRVYRSEVRLHTQDPRIRPGMSCSIEILVDELEDAVQVPVQAVFLDGGEPVVFVAKQGGAIETRAVTVGQNNGKRVHILAGLQGGETVLLSVPNGMQLRPADEQQAAGWPGAGDGDAAGGAGGAPAGGWGGDTLGGGTSGAGGGKPGGGKPEAYGGGGDRGGKGGRGGDGERGDRGERGEARAKDGHGGDRDGAPDPGSATVGAGHDKPAGSDDDA